MQRKKTENPIQDLDHQTITRPRLSICHASLGLFPHLRKEYYKLSSVVSIHLFNDYSLSPFVIMKCPLYF